MKYLLLSEGAPVRPGDLATFVLQAEEAGAIFLTGSIERRPGAIRVRRDAGGRTELVGPSDVVDPRPAADFAILDVASRAEAIAWAGRFAAAAGTNDLEVRQVFLSDDPRPVSLESVG